MKNVVRFLFSLFALLVSNSAWVDAQAIFSGFDFNHLPLTDASFGPNATAVDGDAVSDGTAAYIIANCDATKGFDLTIPNGTGIFNVPSISMEFSFRKTESRSDFFVRGGMSFHQTGGELFVNYRTTDGGSGFIDYGPFNAGYAPPTDGSYHVYSFTYLQNNGVATVKVDGTTVWTYNGPNNRPLYWTGAPASATIGTVMDGNCPGAGTLNYAYFINPDLPLSAEYLSFAASQDHGNVDLAWETTSDGNSLVFAVERSRNGLDFSPIGTLAAAEETIFHYKDVQPGAGQWFYRIRQVDLAGTETFSLVESIILDADTYQGLAAWPNPTNGLVTLSLPEDVSYTDISVIDLQGKTVHLQPAVAQGTVLDLRSLPRGLYSIQCQANGKRHHQFVVLE